MDGSVRIDLDANDIIARIMMDMEEVMDLIQRPTRSWSAVASFVPPSMSEMDAASAPGHADP